ncbi:protein PIF-like [Penaeus indicus]|uniref:protein PIF-like n=1 Tax=Penaeus indicus TaxID=29960 RepID=UPI00300CBB94
MWKSSSSSSSSPSFCYLVLLLVSLLRQNAAQTQSSETGNARRLSLPIQPQEGKACSKVENPGSWLSGDNCCRCKANEVTCRPKPPRCRDPPADTTGCRQKEICGCTEWKCKPNKRKEGGRGQKPRRNGRRQRKENKRNSGTQRGKRRGKGGRRRGQRNRNQKRRARNKQDRPSRKLEIEGSAGNSTSPGEDDDDGDYYYNDYYFDDYMYPDYLYGNMYGLSCSCHTTWVQNGFYHDEWYDDFGDYYSYYEDYPDDGYDLFYDSYFEDGDETEMDDGSSKEFDAFESEDKKKRKKGKKQKENEKGRGKERGKGKRKNDNKEKRKRDRKRERNEGRNRKEKRKVVQHGNSINKENGDEKGDGKRGQFKKKSPGIMGREMPARGDIRQEGWPSGYRGPYGLKLKPLSLGFSKTLLLEALRNYMFAEFNIILQTLYEILLSLFVSVSPSPAAYFFVYPEAW